tara:strand:+ start:11053 stop:11877 length:825 start_codon:yes stop_codon:yes gene_type:complete
MPDFTVLEISDVEGQKALYPAVFSAPNVVSSYESIDIVFPNTLGSSGEVDISDSNYFEIHTRVSPASWSMFCLTIDVDGDYDDSSGSFVNSKNLSVLGAQQNPSDNIIIVKDNLGNSYLPAFNFNGIGNFTNNKAYFMKLTNAQSFSFKGNPLSEADSNGNRAYGSIIPLKTGYNLIGNPLPNVDGLTGEEFQHPTWPMIFNGVTNSDFNNVNFLNIEQGLNGTLIIVKDFQGNVYLPKWGFDGIGVLVAGQGYQLKIEYTGSQTNSGSIEITM